MLKLFVSGAALVAASLSSLPAFAAADAVAPIHISANIPTSQFYAQPRDPNFGKDETMSWDLATRKLRPLRQTYDVKNTEGSIHAYTLNPWLYNGRNAIDLKVVFNGVEIRDTGPTEVVTDAASTPGTSVDLVIEARQSDNRHFYGVYTGEMTLVFDAVPRVPALDAG
jgi:hypothetical protein